MSDGKVVKRRKTLAKGRCASPTVRDKEHVPFKIMSIADFSGVSQQYRAEVAQKPPHTETAQSSPWEVVDRAVSAVLSNMVEMMKHCEYDPFCSVAVEPEFALLSEQELAEHAKRAMQMQKAEMEVVTAEFAVRNIYTRAGLNVKFNLQSPLQAEPPLCDANYHADFLRTARAEAPWERPCVFGLKGRCEAQLISGTNNPGREFLTPEENQALIYAVENDLDPPLPDHPPVCLLCDRSRTHTHAVRHGVEDPSHSFIDTDEDQDQPKLYSVRGRPVTFNTHTVMHGRDGGYRSNCLITSPKGGKVPGLSGAALMYSRSDYVVVDRTGVDGCIWFDQTRLLFPSASIAR
jgi:hypothetical protein